MKDKIIVTLDEKVLAGGNERLEEIERSLEAIGFEPDQGKESLKRQGILVGACPEEKIAALQEQPGVAAVDRDSEKRAF